MQYIQNRKNGWVSTFIFIIICLEKKADVLFAVLHTAELMRDIATAKSKLEIVFTLAKEGIDPSVHPESHAHTDFAALRFYNCIEKGFHVIAFIRLYFRDERSFRGFSEKFSGINENENSPSFHWLYTSDNGTLFAHFFEIF